jgi:hypothetical protein
MFDARLTHPSQRNSVKGCGTRKGNGRAKARPLAGAFLIFGSQGAIHRQRKDKIKNRTLEEHKCAAPNLSTHPGRRSGWYAECARFLSRLEEIEIPRFASE